MNPLEEYPKARKIVYLIFWIVNLGLGAVTIAMLSLGEPPDWLLAVTAAVNFLSAGVVGTAQANVAYKGEHVLED